MQLKRSFRPEDVHMEPAYRFVLSNARYAAFMRFYPFIRKHKTFFGAVL